MLNRYNFEIAALCSKDEDALPMFRGINVSPTGTMVTDGHMAVTVSAVTESQPGLFEAMEGIEPAVFFSPFILDMESALRIAKSLPKKIEDSALLPPIVDATTEDSNRSMVSINDSGRQEILRSRKIEGTYPDIASVMPKPEDAAMTILLSPAILTTVLKAVEKFCNAHDVYSVELRVFGPDQAIRIDAESRCSDQRLTAIVMPRRSDFEVKA